MSSKLPFQIQIQASATTRAELAEAIKRVAAQLEAGDLQEAHFQSDRRKVRYKVRNRSGTNSAGPR